MRVLEITLLSAMMAGAVWAQATAQIHGTVVDTSGQQFPAQL
jgi:hypothetical protein